MASRVKRLDAVVASKGDVIHIPKFTEYAAVQKSAGTALTPQTNTETEFTLTIDQHWALPVRIEDIVKIQSQYDLMSEIVREAGYSLAKKIDSTVSALYSGLTQSVGSAGTAVSDANIVAAIVLLDEADAPMDDRHFVIRPSEYGDILKLDKFVLFQNANKERVNTGEIGEVYGVEVVRSTNITTSGSPLQSNNLMFHRDAFALAIQKQIKVEQDRDILHIADVMVASVLFGAAEFRDTFAVHFIS
jgi:hypothetical protein